MQGFANAIRMTVCALCMMAHGGGMGQSLPAGDVEVRASAFWKRDLGSRDLLIALKRDGDRSYSVDFSNMEEADLILAVPTALCTAI